MQTLGVFSTVAAGGVSHPARLVDATIDANGNRHRYRTPTPHRVISSQTAATLNELLRGVVSDGTGVKAAVPGYTVAGKTGTSRKAPYTVPYKYMASFAGFAPAEAPRFAAVVVLDNPRTNGQVHGGAVAAPVFSKVMQYALHLFHVQPTASIGADAGRSGQVTGAGGGTVSTPVP
jgi:cell division protein FtsI (penicillin-binding protein 3)